MSQLIALIIAIALGAIVTAIGYVFLGDAFTKNSERGVALQFLSQASQIEMAMVAYYAEQTKTSYSADWATTKTELETEGYLKGGANSPMGAYKMYSSTDGTFLVVDDLIATGISENVCLQISKLSGDTTGALTVSDITDAATANTALSTTRYNCFKDAATATKYIFAYKVE